MQRNESSVNRAETLLHCPYCSLLWSHAFSKLLENIRPFFHEPFGPNMLLTNGMEQHALNIRHIVQGDHLHMSMHTRTHTKSLQLLFLQQRHICNRGDKSWMCFDPIRADDSSESLSHAALLRHTEKALDSRTLSNSPIKLAHSSRCSETSGPFYTTSCFKGAPYRAHTGRNGQFESFHHEAHVNFKDMPDIIKASGSELLENHGDASLLWFLL